MKKNKLIHWIKTKWLFIFLLIIFGLIDFLNKELAFSVLYFYILIIKFFLSDYLSLRLRKILASLLWFLLIFFLFLLYYVNHYMPQGPLIETGDIVCLNDERGPCGPEYIEDVKNLKIPSWAKFLKNNEKGLFLGLLFAAAAVSRFEKQSNLNEKEA